MRSRLLWYLFPRLQDIFFISIFLAVLLLGNRMLNMDGDLPRHILVGQVIAQTQKIPSTEPFAYPYQNIPYVSHEWLSDLLFFGIYSLTGLAGTIIVSATLLATAFYLLFRTSVERFNLRIPLLFLFLIGAAATSIHWIARPHLFSMLMLAIWLILTDRLARGERTSLWGFPVLMVLWSNLHGEFIAGILVLLAYISGWTWDFIFDRQNADTFVGKKLWLALFFSTIACLFTPSGIQSWVSLLGFVNNQYMMSRMAESNPPNFQRPEMRILLLLIAFSIFLLGINKKKIPTGQAILLAGFTVMSLISTRNAHLYGMVAAFVLAGTMQGAENARALRHVETTFKRIESQLHGFFFPILTTFILGMLVITSKSLQSDYIFKPSFFPVDAIAWLKENPQEGRMFNDLNWGGYIALNLWPGQSPFIDSIADGTIEAKTQGLLTRQYEAVVTLSGWRDIFTRYNIKWVIVEPQSQLAKMLQDNYRWNVLYQDDVAIILRAPQ
jgi:hypothetical protein